MMSQADEECPLIQRLPEQVGLPGQPHENLLEHIARVLLVANPLKFLLNRHSVT
jgi:hypothetical protein